VIPSAPPAPSPLSFTPSSALATKAKSKPASIDWLGAVLVTVGLLALLFALTEGNVVGWSTPYIPALIVVSVVLIALFTVWQWHLERKGGRPPLMKVSIFRNKKFSAAMIIMMLFFSSFNGYLVYATYFYQDYQGLSPLQTTLRFIPTGVAGVVTTVVTAQLLHIVPTYLLLLFGNISVSVSSLLFAVPIPTGTNYFAWGFFAMILSVFGADTTWPSLTLFTSHSLPQEDQAMGGALVNAVGQVGRSIGLAIATAIQTAVMAQQQGRQIQDVGPVLAGDEAGLAGLRAADWFNFGTALVSVSVVLVAFRGSGIVGKAGVKSNAPTALEKTQADEAVAEPGRGGGEEGVMQEEKTVA
jgi:Na+/melibiose symporter-like transporter